MKQSQLRRHEVGYMASDGSTWIISPEPYVGFSWVNENYDGAPIYADGPPADNRCGFGRTVESCKERIEEWVEESA